MAKMTPEQEAEYALRWGVAKSGLPPDAQLAYDRLADSLVELGPSQLALDERGLQRLDHLLAVGARVNAAGLLRLVAGPDRHRYLLAEHDGVNQRSAARALSICDLSAAAANRSRNRSTGSSPLL